MEEAKRKAEEAEKKRLERLEAEAEALRKAEEEEEDAAIRLAMKRSREEVAELKKMKQKVKNINRSG